MRLGGILGLGACAFLMGCSHDNGNDAATPGVAGGKSSTTTIVGKWKMDPADDLTDPAGTPAGFMKGFASSFWYEFKADKTFNGSMSEGTYSLAGNKLAVTTTKAAGQELHPTVPQMTGELTPDGTVLTLHPHDGPIMKMLPVSLQHGIPMRKEGAS